MINSTQKFLILADNPEISQETVLENVALLREVLQYHSKKYYEENNPEISDGEFDRLFRLLKRWEEKFPEISHTDSPTQKIIGGISSGFKKSKHLVPMISLDNAFTKEDLEKWEERFIKILEKHSLKNTYSFIVEPKFDGLGISCIYEKGKLVRAVTRGDGEEGETVTQNIRTIAEIPSKIPEHLVPEIFEIRGEVVMKKSDFEQLNNQLEKENKKKFSNPRNAAAGSLRQLDSSVTKSRKLSVFFYQSPLEKKNYSEILEFFKAKNINIPHSPYYSQVSSIEEVYKSIQEIAKLRESFDFEIDGAVVKINEYETQQKIG